MRVSNDEVMTNRYYRAGDERAAAVSELFATIARRYDLANDVQSLGLHRVWKRRLVGLAEVRPAEQGLDVCCGTGDLAFALARSGVVATGLDSSKAMLQIAIEKTRALQTAAGGEAVAGNAGNPKFILGDALRLPFSNDTFDIVTVGYGLRNLVDWRIGLGEMARVAKPGGRILVLDFGKPENALLRAMYFGYLRLVVPSVGGLICGSLAAYSYILESLRHYGDQREVAAQMQALGLERVKTTNVLGGVMSLHRGWKRGG